MGTYFEKERKYLYGKAVEVVNATEMLKAYRKGEKYEVTMEEEYNREFFALVNKVNLSLMEDKDNFYGYFLFQMEKIIRFDMTSATSVSFKGAKYVIYFNPIIFLELNIKQMETTIKHEILHIVSQHLIRGKDLKNKYTTLAINMAMDVVVNQYLNYLPPYAITLEYINMKYNLKLDPYKTFEYYLEKIQTELDLQEEDDEGEEIDSNENVAVEFDIEKTHDSWNESDEIDEKTLKEFTEKIADNSQKGSIPSYLEGMIKSLKSNKGELPWNLYLKKLMGTVEANKKKTITRRNRRQPNRLDLRGELRGHRAEIAVAIDISGSISDEEFKQAIKEVLSIVKNYNQEITIIECDKEIRRTYKVKSVKDVKDRMATGGGTEFSPVLQYANNKNINLLVYFTDGKGEERLKVVPKGYNILWVISGRGDELSVLKPYGAVKKLSKVEVKEEIIDISDIRSDGYSMNNQQPIL
ncbi:MAG: VWA-like domain-containing protein [Terrisporobacter othiniensis]|uniref:vWA domain-containing protein n=1 Tax=Terrisporobacter petrolearius TaxID=1460447 RepID=UPI0022E4F2D1|nr:VWA-like domain-containing protein [Terrisporobacter petrolearius]MDU4861519.1 VWA-like domain-containing protein [Terrisporobacter othiniensis]MDU6995562.1 VWA-like domain-containing protein [Terrisporobacter othiniensis]